MGEMGTITIRHKAKKRRLTPLQRKVAVELGKAQLSDVAIAEKYGVDPNTVCNWKHNPLFMEAVDRANQKDISIITAEREEILRAAVEVAKMKDPKAHQDRKMCLEIDGTYQEKREEKATFQQLIIVRAENPIVRPEKEAEVPSQEEKDG